MQIRTVEAGELEEFRAFLDAGLRPESSATRAWEDFPVALGVGNLAGLYGLRDEQSWAAGLSVLVRDAVTSVGRVPVAAIGSVVTRPDRRGEGLSRRLQAAVLSDLKRQEIPLAVLWTDRPGLYEGRGFAPAGWETHLDLAPLATLTPPSGFRCRDFRPDDTPTVTRLYEGHSLRTERRDADHGELYAMPGTRGLVLEAPGGTVRAYAFCGKGEDFPRYVAEWGGEPEAAAVLLGEVGRRGMAVRALVPQGCDELLALATGSGATGAVVASGIWAVVTPARLAEAVAAAGLPVPLPEQWSKATAWLGDCTPVGDQARPGPVALAVWGLDSI